MTHVVGINRSVTNVGGRRGYGGASVMVYPADVYTDPDYLEWLKQQRAKRNHFAGMGVMPYLTSSRLAPIQSCIQTSTNSNQTYTVSLINGQPESAAFNVSAINKWQAAYKNLVSSLPVGWKSAPAPQLDAKGHPIPGKITTFYYYLTNPAGATRVVSPMVYTGNMTAQSVWQSGSTIAAWEKLYSGGMPAWLNEFMRDVTIAGAAVVMGVVGGGLLGASGASAASAAGAAPAGTGGAVTGGTTLTAADTGIPGVDLSTIGSAGSVGTGSVLVPTAVGAGTVLAPTAATATDALAASGSLTAPAAQAAASTGSGVLGTGLTAGQAAQYAQLGVQAGQDIAKVVNAETANPVTTGFIANTASEGPEAWLLYGGMAALLIGLFVIAK